MLVMNKRFEKIFLFFVPTLIVVLLSIYSIQQNILISDDDSTDTAIIKIEPQVKHFSLSGLALVYIINPGCDIFTIKSTGFAPIQTFSPIKVKNLIGINNNSPPDNFLM
jgi:hypothetical protein